MEKGGRKKNPQSSNQNSYKWCQGRIGNLIPSALEKTLGDEGTDSFYLFIFLRFQQKCILDATTELSPLYSQKGFSVVFFFFYFFVSVSKWLRMTVYLEKL